MKQRAGSRQSMADCHGVCSIAAGRSAQWLQQATAHGCVSRRTAVDRSAAYGTLRQAIAASHKPRHSASRLNQRNASRRIRACRDVLRLEQLLAEEAYGVARRVRQTVTACALSYRSYCMAAFCSQQRTACGESGQVTQHIIV